MNLSENSLKARGLQSEHMLEQPCEHRAIIGEDGIVTVLEKVRLVDLDLFAKDTAAIDAAAHYPIDAAVSVIGTVVAVLAKGAAELRDHHDDRIPPPGRSNLFGKSGERAAEFAEAIGEIAGGTALIDVGVPAADVDKAEIELFAHQPSDAARRQFKNARRDRAAVGRRHLFGDRFVDIVANPETFGNRRRKIALRVHVLDQPGLAIVDAGLADTVDPDIRNLRF